ncbi:minichromosome maintenance (MCM) complex subunit [[Leptolyngbya] sp. PCC 7376]|nr:minichromosome maintenance (MCM) complex subunit [[Leptolyngbya] sp. PCC 7376]
MGCERYVYQNKKDQGDRQKCDQQLGKMGEMLQDNLA